ncbi:MAG: MaoC family dehydratase [Haloferacaceae archaeon]
MDAWVRASGHMTNSMIEANRATLAAFGFDGRTGGEEGVESVAYERPEWSSERTVRTPGAIDVGDAVHFSKRFTDDEVRTFAELSGDTNRLHLDDEFAESTRFGRRIVHGTLVSGLISAALARLPGLTIYLSQDVQFLKPVDIGERVTALVEVVEDLGDGRYRLSTEIADDPDDPDDEPYVRGEAIVLIDAMSDEDDEEA